MPESRSTKSPRNRRQQLPAVVLSSENVEDAKSWGCNSTVSQQNLQAASREHEKGKGMLRRHTGIHSELEWHANDGGPAGNVKLEARNRARGVAGDLRCSRLRKG